jgi:hypothetical protein
MTAQRKHFSLLRVLALLAVLLIETALTVSLWASGWLGTGDHLAELPQLKVLLIFGYAVDDDQIQALSRSKSLSHLVLRYSKVTPRGRRRLTDALPDLEIRGD